MTDFLKNISNRTYYWLAAGVIVLLGVIVYLMGQPFMCECGYVRFFNADPVSPENSKHLTDWYTLSHIIHGFVFFWIIHWLAPKWPLGLKLFAAVLPEVVWEIYENTDAVIEYYRQQTVSVEYRGDSVINSVSDVLAMVAGFFLAYRLPWWSIIILILLMEGVTLLFIQDNLILNIIMFIHPFEFITEWQNAAG